MKVNYNGRELNVIVGKDPFAEYVEFYEMDGEWYASLETNFPDKFVLGLFGLKLVVQKKNWQHLFPTF